MPTPWSPGTGAAALDVAERLLLPPCAAPPNLPSAEPSLVPPELASRREFMRGKLLV
jgi:hypothetical protein